MTTKIEIEKVGGIEWVQFFDATIELLREPIVGIVVGTLLIVWQVQKGYRQSLDLQRENAREKLKLEIYQDLNDLIKTAESASVSISHSVRFAPVNLRQIQEGSEYLKSSLILANEIVNQHSAASDAYLDLISFLESYEIVHPAMKTFRLAFNSGLDGVSNVYPDLIMLAFRFLPQISTTANSQSERPILKPAPTIADLSRFDVVSEQYLDAEGDLQGYLFDLRVEAQNLLLGDLFQSKVPTRKPEDDSIVVVSSDPVKMENLERQFIENKKIDPALPPEDIPSAEPVDNARTP